MWNLFSVNLLQGNLKLVSVSECGPIQFVLKR